MDLKRDQNGSKTALKNGFKMAKYDFKNIFNIQWFQK